MNSPYPVMSEAGPFIALETAASLRFMDGRTAVEKPEHYLGWQAEHVVARKIARMHAKKVRIYAVVNHGRWIAHCVSCYQAMFTHPGWQLACCAECGAIYQDVVFPPEIEEITRLLLVRPRRENQNWEPSFRGLLGDRILFSGVWKLRVENKLHGLPR